MRRPGSKGLGVGVLLGSLAAARPATAYTCESAITAGCHEAITSQALRRLRAERPALAPIVPTAEEVPLVDDLPFALAADLHEMGAVALLIGVRDNDFKGNEATDSSRLSLVHADPALQAEHCLRRASEDEPTATATALGACRDYIRQTARQALLATTADGRPDAAVRVSTRVYLAFRGQVEAPLPAFYVHAGRALHALQDSFTHDLRTADHRRVTVITNYVEYAEGPAEPSRDGPRHIGPMDQCEDLDDFRRERRGVAEQASFDLLAALTHDGPAAERQARLEAVLDAYLGHEPGCTDDNRWCDAPELAYDERSACGCALPGDAPARAPAALAVALALAWLGRRRGVLRLTLAIAGSRAASAGEPPVAPAPVGSAPGAAARAPEMPAGRPLGVYAAIGGAIDNAALSTSVALRYRFTERWLGGLDAEWNPWATWQTRQTRPGTINAYATLVHRYPLRAYNLKLRTTGHLGTSTLLFDLYGAPRGSTGPYLGVSFLGLELELSPDWSIVVEPADVALPVPQVRGTPLTYGQYRFTVGVQFGG